MISTITTSTVSAITLSGSMVLVGVIVLFALLVQKEVVSASTQRKANKLNWILNIGIFPMLIIFILVLATRVAQVMR